MIRLAAAVALGLELVACELGPTPPSLDPRTGVFAHGEIGGISWAAALGLREDGRVACLATAAGDSPVQRHCDTDAGDLFGAVSTSSGTGLPTIVSGFADARVASVGVRSRDGVVRTTSTVEVPFLAVSRRAFAVAFDEGTQLAIALAYDARGQPIGQILLGPP